MLDLHIDLYICNFSLKFPLLQDGESGWSSLHRALHFGHLCIAGVLLQFGASLTLEDTKGRTPVDLISCPVSQANGDSPDAGSFLLFHSREWLSPILSTALMLMPSWEYMFRACFMKSFIFFHFSCNGSFQLGKWNKLSAGYWQCPHSKTTMQSRYLAWIIYQNSCCIKVP